MLLPVALNLQNRRVLVVGGGAVAARKVASCLEAGAIVTAISPDFSPDFSACERISRRFQSGDCTGFSLVFAATNAREINAGIAKECRAIGVWCNIADDPRNSDFHTASVIRRGEISMGVTTGALSPVLARSVRQRIEAAIGPEWEELQNLARGYRISPQKRGDAWRAMLQSDVLDFLREGKTDRARQRLEELLHSFGEVQDQQ